MADTLLDRLTNRPTRTESLTFAFDPNDGARLTEARSQLRLARQVAKQFGPDAAATTVVAAQTAVEDAQAVYDEIIAGAVTFTVELRALKPSRVQELVLEHPPTAKQIKTARALAKGDPKGDPHVNEATYLPALLAEAIAKVTISDDADSVLTGLDSDDVARLIEPCSQGDLVILGTTAESLAQASSKVEELGKS